jgi:predicted amidohydrolase YtcJ
MLDIFEEIVDERGFNENRHHLAHNSVVDPEDIPRYRQIGVAADWIAALAGPSQYYESQIPIMGEDRWFEKTYPAGSIANQGGVVVVGTDWPLTPADPFFNIQAAVTRQNPLDLGNEMVLNAKHKMTIPQALQMYTINGAYVMHNEEITGTIEEYYRRRKVS